MTVVVTREDLTAVELREAACISKDAPSPPGHTRKQSTYTH